MDRSGDSLMYAKKNLRERNDLGSKRRKRTSIPDQRERGGQRVGGKAANSGEKDAPHAEKENQETL